MGLTTAQDLAVLEDWGLIRDYNRNKDVLLAVGRGLYHGLRYYGSEPPPSPGDLEQVFILALEATTVFKIICASKGHANPTLHVVFARAMARHILDTDWQSIISV
jgi:hypothetical protein